MPIFVLLSLLVFLFSDVRADECVIDQPAPSEISTDPYALHTVKGPFNRPHFFNLNITSNDDKDLSYQLTTTAQDRLNFHPQNGILPSKGSQTIVVIVEPFEQLTKGTSADLISIEYTFIVSPPSDCLQVISYKSRKIIRIEYDQ